MIVCVLRCKVIYPQRENVTTRNIASRKLSILVSIYTWYSDFLQARRYTEENYRAFTVKRDIMVIVWVRRGMVIYIQTEIVTMSHRQQETLCTSIYIQRGFHHAVYYTEKQHDIYNSNKIVVTVWVQYKVRRGYVFNVLRFYQTRITWLQSLSAILPLFWRHDMANFLVFAANTWEVLLWRYEMHDIFPRNWANALQNLQSTIKFNIFSFHLTGDSDFLILFISTQNKLSMTGF